MMLANLLFVPGIIHVPARRDSGSQVAYGPCYQACYHKQNQCSYETAEDAARSAIKTGCGGVWVLRDQVDEVAGNIGDDSSDKTGQEAQPAINGFFAGDESGYKADHQADKSG